MCSVRHAHVVKSTLLHRKDGIICGEIIDQKWNVTKHDSYGFPTRRFARSLYTHTEKMYSNIHWYFKKCTAIGTRVFSTCPVFARALLRPFRNVRVFR